jgi:hypothetical protein
MMLSHTADQLFWMSRSTKWAEKTAAGGLSPQHRLRAPRVRGSLAGEIVC